MDGGNGFGTVFKLSKSGVIEDLHDFCNTQLCTDGANPAFLMQAMDRTFYGATGPNPPPTSVLFRISPTRTFKVLHSSGTKQKDGTGVFGLIQASNGELLGLQNRSKLFQIGVDGKYRMIGPLSTMRFSDGDLLQASDGNLWGDLRAATVAFRASPSPPPGLVPCCKPGTSIAQRLANNLDR